MLRVLGGTGPAGLAAMSDLQGNLVRPLLPFRRAILLTTSGSGGCRSGRTRLTPIRCT